MRSPRFARDDMERLPHYVRDDIMRSPRRYAPRDDSRMVRFLSMRKCQEENIDEAATRHLWDFNGEANANANKDLLVS